MVAVDGGVDRLEVLGDPAAVLLGHDRNDDLMRSTMQVCAQALGNTASIASGKPSRPSTQQIQHVADAALAELGQDRGQNLAPSGF